MQLPMQICLHSVIDHNILKFTDSTSAQAVIVLTFWAQWYAHALAFMTTSKVCLCIDMSEC